MAWHASAYDSATAAVLRRHPWPRWFWPAGVHRHPSVLIAILHPQRSGCDRPGRRDCAVTSACWPTRHWRDAFRLSAHLDFSPP
jgi:hypothetical protein